MTADWARLPYDVLAKNLQSPVNEISEINRVVSDSVRTTATIEWE